MVTQITCVECARPLRVPEALLGKSLKCPLCGATFTAVLRSAVEEALAGPPPPAGEDAGRPTLQDAVPAPTDAPADEEVYWVERLTEPPPEQGVYWVEPLETAVGTAAATPASRQDDRLPPPRPRPAPRRTSALASIVPAKATPILIVGIVGGGLLVVITAIAALARLPKGPPWQEFAPPDGKFRVLLPGTPVLKTQPNSGSGVTVQMYEVKNPKVGYAVGYGDIPTLDRWLVSNDQRFAGGRDGMLANVPGSQLLNEREIELGGHPGRQFTIAVPGKGLLLARMYIVHSRFFILIVGGDDVAPEAEPVRKFFDSFAVDRDFAAPPAPPSQPPTPPPPPPPTTPPPSDVTSVTPPAPRPAPTPPTPKEAVKYPRRVPGPNTELQFTTKVEPFLAVSIDHESAAVLCTDAEGRLRHYSYPEFELKGTYTLGAPAHETALDGKTRRFFALVGEPVPPSRPGTTRVVPKRGFRSQASGRTSTTTPERTLQLFDVKDVLDGRASPDVPLAPVASLSAKGRLSHLCLSPGGDWLYYLDGTDAQRVKACRVDAESRQPITEALLVPKTEALCLSPDGHGLYSSASLLGHRSFDRSLPDQGIVQSIDPASMRVLHTVEVAADPYELGATNDGLVFLSGGSNQWTDVHAVDMKGTRAVIAQWHGVRHLCYLRLSPDGQRLYLANQDSFPPGIKCLVLPRRLDNGEAREYEITGHDRKVTIGGRIWVSPDGKFLLCANGGVYRLRVGIEAP